MKRLTFLALTLTLLFVVGCSGNVKVGGTVVFSDDNTPVEAGQINFVSKSGDFQARGTIEDGKFQVTSIKPNDGLPKGDYDVYFTAIETITKESVTLPNGDTTEPETAPAIDLKYLSASTSGISQSITGPVKDLEFKLDRNPDLPQ